MARPPALLSGSSRAAPGRRRAAEGARAGSSPRTAAAGGGLLCEPEVGTVEGRRTRACRHFPSLGPPGSMSEGEFCEPAGGGLEARAGGPRGCRGWRRREWGMGAAWRGRSQPPLLPAQRLGPGGGVILHILHPAPPPASIKLGRGKSRPRALPIGRCHLPLWRDWLRAMPGSPDVSSAKFVGRGDLGFGAGVREERWEVRGRGGRPWVGSLLLIRSVDPSLGP